MLSLPLKGSFLASSERHPPSTSCTIYIGTFYIGVTSSLLCCWYPVCYLSRSLDTNILHLKLCWNSLLHPSMSVLSSIGFHLQPCSKGWYLHHSRWSSSSSCNCMCYPWVTSDLAQILLCPSGSFLDTSTLLDKCVWSMEHVSPLSDPFWEKPKKLLCTSWCFHLMYLLSCRSTWKTL